MSRPADLHPPCAIVFRIEPPCRRSSNPGAFIVSSREHGHGADAAERRHTFSPSLAVPSIAEKYCRQK
jgi:hypothetical protein